MTWTSFHRRGDVLRAVVAAADARRDGVLPTDIDGVHAVFADDAELLGALQLKWHTRLAGRIEQAQLHQPMDLPGAVIGAWQETAQLLPGIRAVLDHYRALAADGLCSEQVATVMAKSADKEHMALAAMAGLASAGDRRGIAVGVALEGQARATLPVPVRTAEPRTFMDRLKALLPAA